MIRTVAMLSRRRRYCQQCGTGSGSCFQQPGRWFALYIREVVSNRVYHLIPDYNKKYADYICVDAMGNLLKPDYLSNSFQITLQNYHLRRIRFHDLRHSCASLLLANGVPMKMIQEWLGHSDFSTTANIYSHLDYASKVSSAEAMLNGLGMGSNPENDT